MQHKVKNQSGDKNYFVIIPEIVKAKADIFEYSLWATLKMICGEDGECTASVRLLSQLSKIGVSKVVEARNGLLDKGLIEGYKVDEENSQSHWRITIPDLWEENFNWRKDVGESLRARAESYTQGNNKFRKPKNCSPREQNCSPREQNCSPHEQNCSPHEQNCSPHEQNCSPREQNCSPREQNCSPREQNCSPHEQSGNKLNSNNIKYLSAKNVHENCSPQEHKYIELDPLEEEHRGLSRERQPTFSESARVSRQAIVEWWDATAIPAYQEILGYNPGAIMRPHDVNGLQEHAERVGLEKLTECLRRYLQTTGYKNRKYPDGFYNQNNHDVYWFVEDFTKFVSAPKNSKQASNGLPDQSGFVEASRRMDAMLRGVSMQAGLATGV